jgi:hypothetical protein
MTWLRKSVPIPRHDATPPYLPRNAVRAPPSREPTFRDSQHKQLERDGLCRKRLMTEDTMQTPYHHRQVSSPTVVSFIAITALFAMPFFIAGLHLVLFAVLAPIFAFVAVVHWLLYSMTVEVSGQELRWYFGPGFWRKRIVLSEIARVQRVRIPWWYGIGIKYTARAWVYLVAPGDGVEVWTVNGETVRIGTDDAARLMGSLAGR